MAHIALYRTYRPQQFDDLVGQDAIRITLLNAAKLGRMAQAYLFSGPRGTGKTTTARLIAKIVNCEKLRADGNPCDQCTSCTGVQEGRLIDVMEVDGASNRGIDEVRALRDKALFTPTHAKKKVFIIDEVHMLTKEAFNALLKTLEEPVAHVHFILATTEIQKVPPTILSRCQHFEFRRLSEESIVERLQTVCTAEKIAVEPEALTVIAKAADGSMRDALVLVEQLTHDGKLTLEGVEAGLGLVRRGVVEAFLAFIDAKQSAESLAFIGRIYEKGVSLTQFTAQVIDVVRDRMLNAAREGKPDIAAREARLVDVFVETLQELKSAVIPQLPLECAVIELCAVATAPKVTPAPAPAPKAPLPRATAPTGTLTLARIKERWGDVASHIKTSTTKLALRTAKLGTLEGSKLTLIFPSQFELERVHTTSQRNEIEQALKSALGVELEIKCTHQPSGHQVSLTTETIAHPLGQKAVSVDEAASILGGTLITPLTPPL